MLLWSELLASFDAYNPRLHTEYPLRTREFFQKLNFQILEIHGYSSRILIQFDMEATDLSWDKTFQVLETWKVCRSRMFRLKQMALPRTKKLKKFAKFY